VPAGALVNTPQERGAQNLKLSHETAVNGYSSIGGASSMVRWVQESVDNNITLNEKLEKSKWESGSS